MKFIPTRKHSDYLDNPDTQIKFHKKMMRFWVVAAIVMDVIYIASFYLPQWASQIAGFIAIVTNQISFYANWDTDYGALSAAQSTKETMAQEQSRTFIPPLAIDQ